MSTPFPMAGAVVELHQRAMLALQQRREADAAACWRQVLQLSPDDPRAHDGLGRWALRQRDFDGALTHFGRLARPGGTDPRPWVHLATVHRLRGDAQAEEATLFEALKADPQDLISLLMRGQLFERLGRTEEAAQAFGAASQVAPPLERLAPELKPQVEHARAFCQRQTQRLAEHVDAAIADALRAVAGEDLERFRLGLDIFLGRRKRYDAQPMRFFFPKLEPIEFFDRSLFPWLDAIEAGTDLIREELLAVLRADQGLTPYIEYGPDQPVEQWAELNHNPRWSCYHLWKDGQPVAEHVARCPGTMRLLEASPRPVQAGRTPVAMFSLLKPRTRIPPHVGASNARMVCHLPLIVPPGCSFRVGNTVREWVPGQAWVFDDTIEHEARNDSDELRAILIWDTWHPGLSEAERHMMTAMSAALNAYSGVDASYGG